MITLADLRARNTLPSWQEAVAIVQELFHATVTARGSAARVPDVEHIALAPDGSVALLPGSTIPENPVRHLAVMLDLLLEDVTAPEPLLSVVARNVTATPQCATPEEFSNAVAFFERPGRRDDIARLVARAAEAIEQTRADEELKRLKARALAAEGDPAIVPVAETPAGRGRWPLVAAAIIFISAVAGGFAMWSLRDASNTQTVRTPGNTANDGVGDARRAGDASTAGRPAEANKPSLLSRVGSAVKSAVQSLTGTEPEPQQAAAPPPERAGPATSARRRRAPTHANSSSEQQVSVAAAADVPETSVESASIGREGDAARLRSSITAAANVDNIYSAADAEVWPPVVARPVIADPPPLDAPANSVAVFDLVVDPRGVVEQVHLISAPASYRDRMILAHLKAWTFEPALKNGRAVRYRFRVRLGVR